MKLALAATQQVRLATQWCKAILLTVALLASSAVSTGCRDNTSMCQKYVQKYAYCFRRTHQRAEIQQRRLPSSQRQRMAPMLKALADKIQDPTWKQRATQRCIKSPPTHKRFKCIQRTKCRALSKCDPKRPS